MPHRDDQEAARHRIVALERELEDARRRAERAEADAREAHRKASSTEPSPARKDEPRESRSSVRGSAGDARWPPGALERYQRLAGAAALFQLPIAGALAFGLGEESIAVAFMGCIAAQFAATYLIGRVVGAPFPLNGAMVLLVASSISVGAMMLGATGIFWDEVVPPGAGQIVLRCICGLAAVALGIVVAARWTSEAASSDVSSD